MANLDDTATVISIKIGKIEKNGQTSYSMKRDTSGAHRNSTFFTHSLHHDVMIAFDGKEVLVR